jgi:urease accessory protein
MGIITATITTIAMRERALFTLLSWFSPSFPTGAFSFSHALETAIEDGRVHDVADLVAYATTVLEHGAGGADAAFLALALRACVTQDDAALLAIAERAAAMRGSAELALESEAQGRAFLTTIRATTGSERIAQLVAALDARAITPTLPIAVAVAAAASELPAESVVLAFLHGVAQNLVSAGVRLVPLGQTDGQRAIAALAPVVERGVARALAVATPDEVTTAAPFIDILSMRHETLYTRLFLS